MSYYAIQDRGIGYIQWVGEADDEMAALRAFDDDVGIDPHDEGLEAVAGHFQITELTETEYSLLKGCDGTATEDIDYLESIK